MTSQWAAKQAMKLASIAAVATALVIGGATLGPTPAPANASTPGALQLADHALSTSQSLLADESPYELIDPIGPGGITQSQAVNEVGASTMIGGLYNDGNGGHYGGGYGQLTYLQPALLGGYSR